MIPIGSVQNYVNTVQLKYKWNIKKQEMSEGKTSLIEQMQKSIKENKLSAIVCKLKSGKKLSSAEMDTLRKESPDLYRKALLIQQEREAFESALANCKTKEEADRLRFNKIQALSSQIKSIEQSGMSEGDKIQAIEFVGMKVAAINDSFSTFVHEGKYAKLKSEVKEQKERDMEELADKAAEDREKIEENNEAEDPERPEIPGSPKDPEVSEEPEVPEIPKPPEMPEMPEFSSPSDHKTKVDMLSKTYPVDKAESDPPERHRKKNRFSSIA